MIPTIQEQGGKQYHTAFTSPNLPVIRIYLLRQGLELVSCDVTLPANQSGVESQMSFSELQARI